MIEEVEEWSLFFGIYSKTSKRASTCRGQCGG